MFNNLGPVLIMDLKFSTSVTKRLKLKVRKFWGLISTFVEVTEKKIGWGLFPPILNKDKTIPGQCYLLSLLVSVSYIDFKKGIESSVAIVKFEREFVC